MISKNAVFMEKLVAKLGKAATRAISPKLPLLGAALLFTFLAVTLIDVSRSPMTSWDMIAYTALAYEDDAKNKTDLHAKTWATVEENLPNEDLAVLTQGSPYKVRQYEDPEAFYSVLTFYRMKILYVELTSLLGDLTDPVRAQRLICMVFTAMVIGVITYWACREHILGYGPVIVASLLMLGFVPMAKNLSPDMMASFFLLSGMYSYIRGRDLLAAAALLAAFLTRPDNLAFVGVFFVFAAAYGPGRWIMTALFVVCFIVYKFVISGPEYVGAWIHLWFSHIEYVPTLVGFDPDYSVGMHLQIMVNSTIQAVLRETWIVYLFLLSSLFFGFIKIHYLTDRSRILLFAIFASICAKYLIFPHYEERFQFAYLAGMTLIFLMGLHAQRQSETQSGERKEIPLS
ncbi:hypothetical protein DYI23_15465 [Roseibium polysiphoniae]|uniref:Uncharacterized protein n=2 Tax=Roseibium polysiphoniae TaxID=2571221 RepID=A0A944GTL0_9HYPH|nr:hypothetical protein [Roseibium polysiphoniae]